MKIDLQIPNEKADRSAVIQQRHWRQSAPFVLNPRGILIHRVRRASTLLRQGMFSHHAATYWCGNGTTGKGLEFVHEPPADRLVCARCEEVAIAAGKPSSSDLCGRHVCTGNLKAHRLCCHQDDN